MIMPEQEQSRWAEQTVNIQRGCEHDCRYCYARAMAVRSGRCTASQWCEPVMYWPKINQVRRKRRGVLMFPSAHDITPSNISECLTVLGKLLAAGNQVLIVSKPHLACIEAICDELADYREQILFRFTIGSTIGPALDFWEPGAPSFGEREDALKYAHFKGFRTSVSCEPYLDSAVQHTYIRLNPYITESFWIGKLRRLAARVDMRAISAAQMAKFVEPLQQAQSDEAVRRLYELLNGNPLIKWKDSIRELIGHGRGEMSKCQQCGRCCNEVGRTFWKGGDFRTITKLRRRARDGDYADDAAVPCEMLKMKGELAICTIHRDYGYSAKPPACRNYPEAGELCFRQQAEQAPAAPKRAIVNRK
jgi:hypothetical protein